MAGPKKNNCSDVYSRTPDDRCNIKGEREGRKPLTEAEIQRADEMRQFHSRHFKSEKELLDFYEIVSGVSFAELSRRPGGRHRANVSRWFNKRQEQITVGYVVDLAETARKQFCSKPPGYTLDYKSGLLVSTGLAVSIAGYETRFSALPGVGELFVDFTKKISVIHGERRVKLYLRGWTNSGIYYSDISCVFPESQFHAAIRFAVSNRQSDVWDLRNGKPAWQSDDRHRRAA